MEHTLYLIYLIHAKEKQTDESVKMTNCGFTGEFCVL